MKYDKNSIEKRKFITKNIVKFIKIAIFVFAIIILYNIFLVILSASDQSKTTNMFGYSAYIITTDSMKPTLYSGDVVVVKKIKANDLKRGDIITFVKDSQVVTHRIVNKIEAGLVTKGDNNSIEDMYVVNDNEILGVEVFKISSLGKVIKLVNNVVYIIIITIILLTVYLHIRRKNYKKLIRRRKKNLEDEKDKYEEYN